MKARTATETWGRCAAAAALTVLAALCAGPASGANYGVLVGIDHYSPLYGAGVLPSCVNDANGFQRSLLGDGLRWPASNVTTLLDSGAGKSAIRATLTQIAAKAVSGDVVVYFQSSHGGQYSGTATFLCSYDGDYADYELASDLARFAGGVKVIVVIDACHAAGMYKGATGTAPAWDFAGNVTRRLAGIKAANAVAGADIGWMVACNFDQNSWAGYPYSVFAGYVIDAFAHGDANHDGHVTFLELFNYAAPRASALAPGQTAQKQNEGLLGGTVASVVLHSTGYCAFSVSFPNQWLGVIVWDAASGAYVIQDNVFSPTRIEVPGLLPNRWYWIGLWNYGTGTWAYGGWTCRAE